MKAGLLEHYRVFTAIARRGSLTAAAEQLNTNQPTISRQLAALERQLGSTLFLRSSRSLRLSEAGRLLLPHAEALMAAAEATAQALNPLHQSLTGRLRVACSAPLARRVLLPALETWLVGHPELKLELRTSDALEPLISSGIDVALRLGEPADSNLVQTPLGRSYSAVYGAKRYLDRRGRPQEPKDLSEHACLLAPSTASPWQLGDETVPVTGAMKLTSVDLLRSAVEDGLGLALLPTWFWRDAELISAGVERVLPDQLAPARPLIALTATRPSSHGKALAFIAFAREAWRRLAPNQI